MWFITYRQFPQQTDVWTALERSAGHAISYDETRPSYSPFGITRHLRNVYWTNSKGTTINFEDIYLTARPWRWRSLETSFDHGTVITSSTPVIGGAYMLDIDHGTARVAWDNRGLWTSVHKTMNALRLTHNKADILTAENLTISVTRADAPPKDHTETSITLDGKAENLTLKTEKPLPFGNTVVKTELALRIMGVAPDFTEKNAVAAWNAASGVIEIDSFKIAWPPLQLALQGTLALNNQLQPEGAFSGTIGDRDSVIQALVSSKWIGSDDAAALKALTPTSQQATLSFPISIQDSGLYLGMARIATIPTLAW